MSWTVESSVESQVGKIAICTGANSGLGWWFTKFMVSKGAKVIAAVRSVEKGEQAKSDILKELKEHKDVGTIDVLELDLADLDSVKSFADTVKKTYEKIDILCNNAGVMGLPSRQLTKQGFEMQLGCNHLGHFALTLQLLPLLEKSDFGGRIVNVSSDLHQKTDRIFFDDLQLERYHPWRAYYQSKLANILFTMELNRRLKESGSKCFALSCHPGFCATNLIYNATDFGFVKFIMNRVVLPCFARPAAVGALALLRCAVDPKASADEYYGPPTRGRDGSPVLLEPSKAARDAESAKKLWEVSEELTKVTL